MSISIKSLPELVMENLTKDAIVRGVSVNAMIKIIIFNYYKEKEVV